MLCTYLLERSQQVEAPAEHTHLFEKDGDDAELDTTFGPAQRRLGSVPRVI